MGFFDGIPGVGSLFGGNQGGSGSGGFPGIGGGFPGMGGGLPFLGGGIGGLGGGGGLLGGLFGGAGGSGGFGGLGGILNPAGQLGGLFGGGGGGNVDPSTLLHWQIPQNGVTNPYNGALRPPSPVKVSLGWPPQGNPVPSQGSGQPGAGQQNGVAQGAQSTSQAMPQLPPDWWVQNGIVGGGRPAQRAGAGGVDMGGGRWVNGPFGPEFVGGGGGGNASMGGLLAGMQRANPGQGIAAGFPSTRPNTGPVTFGFGQPPTQGAAGFPSTRPNAMAPFGNSAPAGMAAAGFPSSRPNTGVNPFLLGG